MKKLEEGMSRLREIDLARVARTYKARTGVVCDRSQSSARFNEKQVEMWWKSGEGGTALGDGRNKLAQRCSP